MSRYEGEFHGSVIAEFALFKVGDLKFYSDAALTPVRILPLVNDAVFGMSSD
jgi:hypothetical protein